MSGGAAVKQSPAKSKPPKEKKGQVGSSGTERLKTVIRRLPPNLPEDVFWQSVQSWVTDDTTLWKMFYPGKVGKRINKENIPSRAYIAFRNEEQLAIFSREYDGHLFRDKAGLSRQLSLHSVIEMYLPGNESQAVVEFAPYQKIPTEKKKADARNATIEKDEDYLSFVESLNAANKAEPVSLEALIAAAQPPPPPTTTPLLEALKAEKSAQKDKEAILRHHAHYKDGAVALTPAIAKKDDSKKKPAPTPKQPETPQLSKKAAKKAAAQKNAQAAQSAAASSASSTVKQIVPAPATKPSRPPRDPSGRQQQAKTSLPPAVLPAVQTNIQVTGAVDAAEANSLTPTPRRGRPVIGLGRQFEAALSGAGVGVGEQRKRREKAKEPEGKLLPSNSAGTPQKAKESGGTRKDGKVPLNNVVAPVAIMQAPSILQRNDGSMPQGPMILQRPQSPRAAPRPADSAGVAEIPHNHASDVGTGRGAMRRGRGGKGRGGAHRGG
ncbi:hypothetical protein SERLADRAFT_436716 [Serpula lacrymans var. lacrymans S7.9]|uniref:UPF3 domain-containing protein n=1 Tax=Serpula lacrymans var. lacrymans (strain S7.9) TaxID=578457 RepID=F8NS65_SERL9|nr:uncharacterized protein SERLADRAFT_436716 [Serpula lacrymans var. lacrymans S7.9]EGO26896.1 hypothetical protein SERLADRAFT_436716 [Serpula lacrymans var. lacrymans S7.9]